MLLKNKRGLSSYNTLLLEHEHGLWGSVDREGVGPLHRAATLTWHAVTAPRVGKPQVLWRKTQVLIMQMPLILGR